MTPTPGLALGILQPCLSLGLCVWAGGGGGRGYSLKPRSRSARTTPTSRLNSGAGDSGSPCLKPHFWALSTQLLFTYSPSCVHCPRERYPLVSGCLWHKQFNREGSEKNKSLLIDTANGWGGSAFITHWQASRAVRCFMLLTVFSVCRDTWNMPSYIHFHRPGNWVSDTFGCPQPHFWNQQRHLGNTSCSGSSPCRGRRGHRAPELCTPQPPEPGDLGLPGERGPCRSDYGAGAGEGGCFCPGGTSAVLWGSNRGRARQQCGSERRRVGAVAALGGSRRWWRARERGGFQKVGMALSIEPATEWRSWPQTSKGWILPPTQVTLRGILPWTLQKGKQPVDTLFCFLPPAPCPLPVRSVLPFWPAERWDNKLVSF